MDQLFGEMSHHVIGLEAVQIVEAFGEALSGRQIHRLGHVDIILRVGVAALLEFLVNLLLDRVVYFELERQHGHMPKSTRSLGHVRDGQVNGWLTSHFVCY